MESFKRKMRPLTANNWLHHQTRRKECIGHKKHAINTLDSIKIPGKTYKCVKQNDNRNSIECLSELVFNVIIRWSYDGFSARKLHITWLHGGESKTEKGFHSQHLTYEHAIYLCKKELRYGHIVHLHAFESKQAHGIKFIEFTLFYNLCKRCE